MTPNPAPTVADVARAAGVSTATVSRALNRPDDVRPALRQAVVDAVQRLGYVAHAGARALSLRRSGTVGAVVPTIDNAIFAHGLQAFQRRMVAAGRHVLVAFSDYDPDQEAAQVRNLVERGVDAVALTGLSQRPALIELLQRRDLPFVHIGAWPAPAGQGCVGFRNREAMARPVDYLVDLGHRRIAMLAGITAANDRAAARVAGTRAALKRHGLALAGLVQARYDVAAAREAVTALLAARPAPTAIVCGNDVLAWGAMLQAQAMGLVVPRDLSVIGFDDLALSRQLQPALTTVHVPIERMWTMAADQLVQRIEGQPGILPEGSEVQVELVVRRSTAPPPAARRGKRG
ncbi:MAG: LacI family DNA-binding transcriptional regulator [Aquabacterium sp.]